jgi:hypothetical protein
LVTTSSGRITIRAGALNIAVRQKALAIRAVGLRYSRVIDIALILQGKEYVLGYPGMVSRAGSGEQIKGDAQFLPRVKKLLVIFGSYFTRRFPFLLSTDGYWCAMLV